ncbi:MAG TPA: AsmA family protein [Bordetella sp.]|nr:AsmA family protein [Bordetella sp.]
MKTWIKRISIGVAVVVALAVAGLAVFLLTFDPNSYKDRLQEWVQQRYHRTLTIDGDIEATLFPRLGVTLQGVSLSEPNSADTFASMDSARMSVAIWPLLSRNVVVDHASFSGVKARVVRDKQGHLNFQDLLGDGAQQGKPTTAPQDTGQPSAAPRIDIAGLDIKDGEVQLRDDATGRALAISQLNAKTGRVRIDEPFDASLSAHLQGDTPRFNTDIAGKVTVRMNPQAQRYELRKLDLKASGQLPGANARNLTARGDLAYDGQSGAVDAGGLELVFQGDVADVDGGTASVDASLAAEKLSVDPRSGAIQAAKVAVRAKGALPRGPFEFAADMPALAVSPTTASGDAVSARLRISGNDGVDARLALNGITGNSSNLSIADTKLSADIKQADRGWNVTAASPMTLDLRKRAGALSALAGEIAITGPGLPGGAMHVPYTGAVRADMTGKSADLRLDAQLDGGKLALTADATRLGAKPELRFALSADTLDIDKLMPPQAEPAHGTPGPTAGDKSRAAASSGGANGGKQESAKPAANASAPGAAASGSAGPDALPSVSGNSSLAGTASGNPPSGGAAAPSTQTPSAPAGQPGDIDLSALVGPTAQGTIKAGRIVARGVSMQNLSATVKLAQGKLDVSPLAANLYNGKLAGAVSLDAAHDNAISTRFTLDGVAVGPLLADLTKRSSLTGVGSVAANLTTSGRQSLAMRDNLAGTVQLRVRDGAIKGFDVARALRDLKQALLGGKGNAPTDVPADSTRETTFSRMDADLTLAAGVATIKRLDVASPVIHVSQGSPAVIDLPKGTLNVVANVKIADPPPADLRELRGVAVPVQVAGAYDDLRYRVDWHAVAGDAVTRVLERALGAKGADKQNDESRQDRIKDLGRILKGITGK